MKTKTKEMIEVAIEEKSEQVPEVMLEEVTALQEALSELDIKDRKSSHLQIPIKSRLLRV